MCSSDLIEISTKLHIICSFDPQLWFTMGCLVDNWDYWRGPSLLFKRILSLAPMMYSFIESMYSLVNLFVYFPCHGTLSLVNNKNVRKQSAFEKDKIKQELYHYFKEKQQQITVGLSEELTTVGKKGNKSNFPLLRFL